MMNNNYVVAIYFFILMLMIAAYDGCNFYCWLKGLAF